MAVARARARQCQRLILPTLLLLAGSWLRWQALTADLRFTSDEAWFSTFARAAAIKGDWWLPGALDKTPLALYANALAQVAIGPHELAARTPGALAGILLLPLLYVIARDCYAEKSLTLPALTLLLAACSPVLAGSGAMALTDGLMLTGIAASFWMALRNHAGWSAMLLGLALAGKQQATLALPLILWAHARAAPLSRRRMMRFTAALALCGGLLLLWDALRPGEGIHTVALRNNAPGALAAIADLPGRLAIWADHASALLWPGIPGGLLLLAALAALLHAARAGTDGRHSRADLALALYTALHGLLHVLPAAPQYERYLLLAVPALLPLYARGLVRLSDLAAGRLPWRPGPAKSLPALALLLLLLQPAPPPDPNAGIDDLGAWLAAKPVATVVYDHWLGWQLGFYLGTWHDKRLTWYPAPAALARDARQLCEIGPRYLPAPNDVDLRPWLEALQGAGFAVSPVWHGEHFQAWQLQPPWRSVDDCPDTP